MCFIKRRNAVLICFICYCCLMLWLLFIRYRSVEITDYWHQVSTRINLVPFSSISSMIRTLFENRRLDVLDVVIYNLGGNIIMLIPLGFFPPLLWAKVRSFPRTMALCTIIMTTVEVTQLVTLRGFCELDDVILNLTGAAIGYSLSKKYER